MFTNNGWPRCYYYISPNKSWWHDFFNRFDSPDIQIWPENSDGVPNWYKWGSIHFNSVSSPQELRDRTASLKTLYDGAMALFYGEAPILLDRLCFEETNDQLAQYGQLRPADVTVEPFCQQVIEWKIQPHTSFIKEPSSCAIFLARYDSMVKDILKYIGVNGMSYMTLFACHDWMEAHGWDKDEITTATGWSRSRLKYFTQTANNPAYLGPFCRHGGVDELPKRPMSLEDAQGGISLALKTLFNERANKVKLLEKVAILKYM